MSNVKIARRYLHGAISAHDLAIYLLLISAILLSRTKKISTTEMNDHALHAMIRVDVSVSHAPGQYFFDGDVNGPLYLAC
jgi:hypothetical protein